MSNQKYYGRSQSHIHRDNSAIDVGERLPSWFADYVNALDSSGTTSKRQNSLYDQINSILGNKSKYSTVEEAVADMGRRTGLTEVLKKKQASNGKHSNARIFKDIPELKTFIDNYIDDRPGTSIEAVVHDLLKIRSVKDKLPQGDDVPDDIRHYINNKLYEMNAENPKDREEDFDLGKADLSVDDNLAGENDPFSGCEPVKDK